MEKQITIKLVGIDFSIYLGITIIIYYHIDHKPGFHICWLIANGCTAIINHYKPLSTIIQQPSE